MAIAWMIQILLLFLHTMISESLSADNQAFMLEKRVKKQNFYNWLELFKQNNMKKVRTISIPKGFWNTDYMEYNTYMLTKVVRCNV
jgi:hypothetical protein